MLGMPIKTRGVKGEKIISFFYKVERKCSIVPPVFCCAKIGLSLPIIGKQTRRYPDMWIPPRVYIIWYRSTILF